MDHGHAPGKLRRECIRNRTGAVWRVVVDHDDLVPGHLQNLPDQVGEVLPFVVGRDYDRRLHLGLSARSVEICSETSPTRKIITARTIKRTEELVMWC